MANHNSMHVTPSAGELGMGNCAASLSLRKVYPADESEFSRAFPPRVAIVLFRCQV